jgi:hypothetical protein
MDHQIYISQAIPGRSISKTLLLLASLREFGGRQADSPFWVLYPEAVGEFNAQEIASLQALGGEMFAFDLDQDFLHFPFGAKVRAAAAAEKLAAERSQSLIWMDEDSLVLSEPDQFSLPADKSLGYRPVHHQLLGTAWEEQPGPFWKLIYQACQASWDHDFPLITHVGEKIRPYFNAGSFVVRPEHGLLAAWWQTFQVCWRDEHFQPFFEKDPLYAVFLHQMVFTGILLSQLDRREMNALSPDINYPLHLHQEIPPRLRAASIDDLVTVRYENILTDPDWQEQFPISRELAGWIQDQQQRFHFPGASQ